MQIEIGNPSTNPASFTRFVLPFAYSECDFKGYWEEILSEDDKEARKLEIRKSYFTAETSQVLFDQASYFRFKESELSFSYGKIKIAVSPKIVLFEEKAKQENSILKTGFLILEIYFEENQEIPFEMLLEINELFRYKKKPYDEHINPLSKNFCERLSESDILGEIAKKFGDKDYGHWEILLRSFIGEKFSPMNDCLEKNNPDNKNLCWDIYADSRTFVWTCAVTKDGAATLQKRFRFQSDHAKEKWEAHNYGHWVKLLNVDKARGDDERKISNSFDSGKVHQTTAFERDWAKERTYHRWEEVGGYYGFSYHSGAALIPSMTDPDLWKHFGQMYFDMILLLFYTRVTLFRFSNKLTEISIVARTRSDQEKQRKVWSDSFRTLRWEFTLFTNLYRFPLISNQQQAIEMFDIAKTALDIDEFYNEIQQEIHNSQEFVEQMILKTQSESSLNLSSKSTDIAENSLKLTRLATGGLVIGMALTMLGTELSKRIGSIISKYIPDTFRTENGLSVDWFLILLYIPIFWLLLTIIVKVWEKLSGGKK